MEERVYKVMRGAGAWSLVLGILGIVAGVAGGTMLIALVGLCACVLGKKKD